MLFRSVLFGSVSIMSGQAPGAEALPTVTVVGAQEAVPAQKSMAEAIREVRDVPGGAAIVDMETIKQGRVATWVEPPDDAAASNARSSARRALAAASTAHMARRAAGSTPLLGSAGEMGRASACQRLCKCTTAPPPPCSPWHAG